MERLYRVMMVLPAPARPYTVVRTKTGETVATISRVDAPRGQPCLDARLVGRETRDGRKAGRQVGRFQTEAEAMRAIREMRKTELKAARPRKVDPHEPVKVARAVDSIMAEIMADGEADN